MNSAAPGARCPSPRPSPPGREGSCNAPRAPPAPPRRVPPRPAPRTRPGAVRARCSGGRGGQSAVSAAPPPARPPSFRRPGLGPRRRGGGGRAVPGAGRRPPPRPALASAGFPGTWTRASASARRATLGRSGGRGRCPERRASTGLELRSPDEAGGGHAGVPRRALERPEAEAPAARGPSPPREGRRARGSLRRLPGVEATPRRLAGRSHRRAFRALGG